MDLQFYLITEAIAAEVDLIEEEVCSQAPDMETCHAGLPEFWRYIALALFDPQMGWFSPSSLCTVSSFLNGMNNSQFS